MHNSFSSQVPLDEVQVSVDAERPMLDEQSKEGGAAGAALRVANLIIQWANGRGLQLKGGSTEFYSGNWSIVYAV